MGGGGGVVGGGAIENFTPVPFPFPCSHNAETTVYRFADNIFTFIVRYTVLFRSLPKTVKLTLSESDIKSLGNKYNNENKITHKPKKLN